MRKYGIHYDTGLTADGDRTRKHFDDAVVRRELQIIATDLHATAVRVVGDDLQRLARAGEHALAAGLELWFSPVPINLEPGALPGYFARCAAEAERLRRAHEGRVVLVLGCEISLWCAGFLPGGDTVSGRIATVTDPALQRKPEVMAALASGLERARHTLRDIVRAARETFAGPVTYAAAPWETVDWDLFDLVSVDAYRDAGNAANYRDELRAYRRFGKPVAVTEFGCCTYRGAADRGGMGWMIVDEKSDPPVIPGTYQRDEEEQVRHLHDMLAIYEAEDIDSAFWCTFAGFEQPRHYTDPHRDLDLASYGVVAVLDHARGTTYPDMAWEPKQVFGALAAAYARMARPGLDTRHAHPARVYNYWLGGKDNFAADREAAEQAIAANPGIVADVRANRAFLGRAVRYLAAECGIRQFLDIGTGLPTAGNTHQVAQAAAPAARIVYVDNDPVVLSHAQALLTSAPDGATAYLEADLRDVGAIVQAAAGTLDFGEPVALMLLIVLHLIPDTDDPYGIVSALVRALPSGSYLVLSHPASDIRAAQMAEMTRRVNERMSGPKATMRDRAAVTRFFDGLDLLAPGVVQPQQWRPEPGVISPAQVTAWCGVARYSA